MLTDHLLISKPWGWWVCLNTDELIDLIMYSHSWRSSLPQPMLSQCSMPSLRCPANALANAQPIPSQCPANAQPMLSQCSANAQPKPSQCSANADLRIKGSPGADLDFFFLEGGGGGGGGSAWLFQEAELRVRVRGGGSLVHPCLNYNNCFRDRSRGKKATS